MASQNSGQKLTISQNTRLNYVSSRGILHQTRLGHISEHVRPDLPFDADKRRRRVVRTPRAWKSATGRQRPVFVEAPDVVRRNLRPLPSTSPMAPNGTSQVIDLSKSDDDEVPPRSRVAPAGAAQQQRQPFGPSSTRRKHGTATARTATSSETIEILSSPEPPKPQQSHARSSDWVNGKAKKPSQPHTKQTHGHVSSKPSLVSRPAGSRAPELKNGDRQHEPFGIRKQSAVLNRGSSSNRSEASQESRAKSKPVVRPQTMSSKGAPSTSSGLGALKRPREYDRSFANEAPLSKKSRLEYVKGKPALQGSVPAPKSAKAGRVIDLIESEANKSPKAQNSTRNTGTSGTELNITSGTQARAPPKPSPITSSTSEVDKSRTGREAPLRTTVINGEGAKAGTSASDTASTTLRKAAPPFDRASTDVKSNQPPPDVARVSEIPESEPGTPNSVAKAPNKQKVEGSPATGSGTPVSAERTRELFNKGFNSGRSSNSSSRSSPINGEARKTLVHDPAGVSASNASASNSGTCGRPTKVNTAVPKPLKSIASDIPSKSMADKTFQQAKSSLEDPQQALKQRKFPLSPSETSIEDEGRPKRDNLKKPLAFPRVPFSGSEKTPEKANSSRLEIPESASKSQPSTSKRHEGVTSPNKNENHLLERSSAPPPQKITQSATGKPTRGPLKQTNAAPAQVASELPAVDSVIKPKDSAEQQRIKENKQIGSFGTVRNIVTEGPRSEPDYAQPATGSSPFKVPKATLANKALPSLVNMSTSNQIEHIVGRYVEELHGDNEYWIQTGLKKARATAEDKKPDTGEPTDVFAKLKPIEMVKATSKKSDTHAKFGAELHTAKNKVRSSWQVPCSLYETNGDDVPNYSHYVSIQNNFLARNDTTLQHWPYFGDEFDYDDAEGLSTQYYLDVRSREQKLINLAKAESLAPYAEDMLQDAGCQWSDVLYFLLDPKPDVGSDAGAQEALARRDSQFCGEDFARSRPRWLAVLSKLPQANPEKIGKAALLCDHFQRLAKLQLWHVARLSDYARSLLKEDRGPPSNDDLTCRVCMQFNCPYHGEMREDPDSDDDDDDTDRSDPDVLADKTDIIHPPNVNFRSRVGFPPSVSNEAVQIPKERRTLRYWQTGSNASLLFKPDERGPFYPCHHPGESCSTAHCSCFENRLPCEKSCGCPADCSRKFQGCSCSSRKDKKGNRMVCFEADDCVCFQLGRECDPDLCGDCDVCDVLDPCYREDNRILHGNCRNANIQRGVSKHTVLGDSGVHGLGLYACDDVREHEFLGEYKGEIVTKLEAERRGAIYEHQKLSYLFSLNTTQEIDSTHFGNKVRFINHARAGKGNLYPRIQLVNTVHRIALYGSKKINQGEELFFDYGPMFPDEQLGGKTGKKMAQQGQSKAAPHVRNSMITKEFYDLAITKDEVGNVRARKALDKDGGKVRAVKSSSRSGHQRTSSSAMRKKPREEARAGPSRRVDDKDAAGDPDVEMSEAPNAEFANEDDMQDDEQGWSYDINRYNVESDDADMGRAAGQESEDDAFDPEEQVGKPAASSDEDFQSESDEEDLPMRRRGRPRRLSL